MSRSSKRSILSHGHSIISGTVVCLSCWSAVPSATAQESESRSLMAFLSVPTTTAASSRTNISERTDRAVLTVREPQPMLMSDRKPTSAEAWEHFETEYSPSQKSPSSIKRQIETGKYGLDTAVFWRVAGQSAREARPRNVAGQHPVCGCADNHPVWQVTYRWQDLFLAPTRFARSPSRLHGFPPPQKVKTQTSGERTPQPARPSPGKPGP